MRYRLEILVKQIECILLCLHISAVAFRSYSSPISMLSQDCMFIEVKGSYKHLYEYTTQFVKVCHRR